jgi:hypothetical protein
MRPRNPPASTVTGESSQLPSQKSRLSGCIRRRVSYSEAVDYWFLHGAPDRMDEDLNGIPCETVYPPADVSAYW